jgi:hypothetical protein
MVASTTAGELYFMKGTPDGTDVFDSPLLVASDLGLVMRMVATDVNGDGRQDLVLVEALTPSLRVIVQE